MELPAAPIPRQVGLLKPRQAASYISDVLAGLEYLHSRGVVHGNIKPDNVLLTPEGRCKLTDFGLAAGDGDTSPAALPLRRMSAFGSFPRSMPTLLETLAASAVYAAPEATPDHLTLEADVWSLGILLLEMVTGEVPHRDLAPHAARAAMMPRAIGYASSPSLAALAPRLRAHRDSAASGATTATAGSAGHSLDVAIPDNMPAPLQVAARLGDAAQPQT